MKQSDWEQFSTSCPRCFEQYDSRYPALSRADNKTHICSPCGEDEGLTQWFEKKAWYELSQPSDWPVHRQFTLPEMYIENGKVHIDGKESTEPF